MPPCIAQAVGRAAPEEMEGGATIPSMRVASSQPRSQSVAQTRSRGLVFDLFDWVLFVQNECGLGRAFRCGSKKTMTFIFQANLRWKWMQTTIPRECSRYALCYLCFLGIRKLGSEPRCPWYPVFSPSAATASQHHVAIFPLEPINPPSKSIYDGYLYWTSSAIVQLSPFLLTIYVCATMRTQRGDPVV